MKEALLFAVARWFVGKLGLLVLLVVALLLAPSVRDLWSVARNFEPSAWGEQLKKGLDDLAITKDSAPQAAASKLLELQERLNRRRLEREAHDKERCLLPTCNLVKQYRLFQLDVEIELLEKGLTYGQAVVKGRHACDEEKRVLNEIRDLLSRIQRIEQSRPRISFKSREQKDLEDQVRQKERLREEWKAGCVAFNSLPRTASLDVDSALKRASAKYPELVEYMKSGERLWESAKSVLGTALAILLGILLIPVAVKVAIYYGIAPIAARKYGVRLFPEATGSLRVSGASSAMQRVELAVGEELLVDPALLRSTPEGVKKNTQLLFSWRMPLSSLASRLYLLTRLRSVDKPQVVQFEAGEGDLDEIAVLHLDEGAALVLQPRSLVGVVQSIDRPVRITRHWRLRSLGCWLTMQLRYLVFHGPGRLIVRGRRGVAVDPVHPGTAINQAATLGFSANLGYGVSRCETYYGYHSGKQELFNDRFSGGEGYVIHEVHPKRTTALLLPGRGIEGMLNSILKVFGI